MKKTEIRKILNIFLKKKFKIKKNLQNISMQNVEKWDSLAHLILVNDLEKKFNIKFSQIEISKITDEKKIYSVIKKKSI
tara:strand:+ start:616 stop:852 length:237 start_codon:yes stop_codon:yes gene_type:complete